MPERNLSELTQTLAELVAINSVNPEWGGPGEVDVARYVVSFFRAVGLECELWDVLPNRPNVYVKLPGRDSSRRIVLEAHMDTVGVGSMTIPPFEPVISRGILFGRGSCDVKAGLAAMMHAIRDVHLSKITPPCDVWLAAVVDEEHLFRGVSSLIDRLSSETTSGVTPPGIARIKKVETRTVAVVAEPTDCRIVTANKGVLRWRIITTGKSAHSSKPELGRNAITDMMQVIAALQADSLKLQQRRHSLVGPPTLCISMIEGGSQINFVPDRCQISLDRRLLPDESASKVFEHYRNLVSKIPGIECQVQPPILSDDAMETREDEPVVVSAKQVAQSVGISCESTGVPFGCDATKLSRAGVPGIIFGPGNIDQAHADVEFVELDQVELARRFYRTFIMESFA
ncbi:M20 family metallopeptidase [Stieleria varia]|uniref:N-formyl-4-amino-5-aminomethyl-2-methylpyrimidine deformylase n=1 Tax=Stieleria varia TaxID=2528005 RepID=A0A5C6B7M1_9BACT|nr:ArgE/DapE family deacylase [Stieleria varia]TWU06504.1 N-formyl-4-amino-5-aminomethyl-2-methylpyrimidine deformylase [Stieleria varia]